MTRKGEPPAFQHYAMDWVAETAELSSAARGALITLRSQAWIRRRLPVDEVGLARLAGVTRAEMRRIWPSIQHWFQPAPDGGPFLVEPQIESQRQALDQYRADQARKAEERWAREREIAAKAAESPSPPNAVASARHMPKPYSASASASANVSTKVENMNQSGGISLQRVNELWMERMRTGPFTQGLSQVQERVDFYARSDKAKGRAADDVCREAIDAFDRLVDSFAAGYKPARNGYKFADHWPRIEQLLDGGELDARPPAGDDSVMGVSHLSFAKKDRP